MFPVSSFCSANPGFCLVQEATKNCHCSLLVKANGKQVDSEAGNKENCLFDLPLQSDHAACSNFTAETGDDRVLPVCSLKYFGAHKHLLKWKCFKSQTGVNKFLRSCGMQGRGRGSD